jgi:hypothetical protein
MGTHGTGGYLLSGTKVIKEEPGDAQTRPAAGGGGRGGRGGRGRGGGRAPKRARR